MKKKSKTPDSIPNYWPKLLDLIVGGHYAPGTTNHVIVAHEEWCDIFRRKPCNCDPTISNADDKHDLATPAPPTEG